MADTQGDEPNKIKKARYGCTVTTDDGRAHEGDEGVLTQQERDEACAEITDTLADVNGTITLYEMGDAVIIPVRSITSVRLAYIGETDEEETDGGE